MLAFAWRFLLRTVAHLCGVLALVCWTSATTAQPHIRVRGRAIVQASTFVEVDGLRIAGRIIDEAGTALADRTISLRVEADGQASRVTTRSDEHGDFEHRFPALGITQGDVRVAATIESSSDIDGAEIALPVTRTAAPAEVRIVRPTGNRIDLDEPETVLEVAAVGDARGTLSVDVRNERDELIGAGTLGPNQPLKLSIVTTRLGSQGYGRLKLETRDSTGVAQLLRAIEVLRYRTSHVHLQKPAATASMLKGSIATKEGRPLTRQAVAIMANDKRIATVLSDEQGGFALAMDQRWPRTGPIQVQALHESASPWWVGGRSNTLELPASTPPQPPWWPIALLAAASLGAMAWRQRRTPTVDQLGDVANASGETPMQPDQAGISGATSIHGTIVDSATRLPLSGALVEMNGIGRRAPTDAWGRFHLIDLPSGNHMLTIHADGYERVDAPLALPHSGRWHHVLLRMRSLRTVALSHYRRGIPTLPGIDDATQTHTAQELLALHEQGASDVLRAILRRLTRAFEAAYYAGPPPTSGLLDQVQRSADESEQERNARIV